MPSISNCPKCQQQVSIPAGVEAAAAVHCPLCNAEYALGEALALAPPELIPVLAPVEQRAPPKRLCRSEEMNEAAAVAQGATAGRRLPRCGDRRTSWPARTLGIVIFGLAGCVVGLYGLAFWFLGPRYHKQGFPERIHIDGLVDFPLPGMAWLTGPAEKADKSAAKPAAETPVEPGAAP